MANPATDLAALATASAAVPGQAATSVNHQTGSVLNQPTSVVGNFVSSGSIVVGNVAAPASQRLTIAQLSNLVRMPGVNFQQGLGGGNIIQLPSSAPGTTVVRLPANPSSGAQSGLGLVRIAGNSAVSQVRLSVNQNATNQAGLGLAGLTQAGGQTATGLVRLAPAPGATSQGLVRINMPGGQPTVIRIPAGSNLASLTGSKSGLIRLAVGSGTQQGAIRLIANPIPSSTSIVGSQLQISNAQSLTALQTSATVAASSAVKVVSSLSATNLATAEGLTQMVTQGVVTSVAPRVPGSTVLIRPSINLNAGVLRPNNGQPSSGMIRVQMAGSGAGVNQGRKIIYMASSGVGNQRIIAPAGLGTTSAASVLSVASPGPKVVRYTGGTTGSNSMQVIMPITVSTPAPRSLINIAAVPSNLGIPTTAVATVASSRLDIQQALDKIKLQQKQSQLKVLTGGTLLKAGGAGQQRVVISSTTAGGSVLQVNQQSKQTVFMMPQNSVAGQVSIAGTTEKVIVSSSMANSARGILVNSPGLVQIMGSSNASSGGGQTFYIITNSATSTALTGSTLGAAANSSGATLAALTAPNQQRVTRLIQPGAIMLGSSSVTPSTTTQRIIAVRGAGGKTVQLIPANQISAGNVAVQSGSYYIASGVPGTGGTLTQNQRKANKIIAEAIAKAQAAADSGELAGQEAGLGGAIPAAILDSSKRKRKRKGEGDDDVDIEGEGEGVKKKRQAKPRPKKPKPGIGVGLGGIGLDGLGGLAIEGDDSMIDVVGGEVVVEGDCGEGLDAGSESGKAQTGRRYKRPVGSKARKKKVPKFLKQRNKKKNAESDSDGSDAELKKIYRMSERKKRREENVSGVGTPVMGGGGDSDVDVAPNGSLYEELIQAQTRRSGRSVRKKYVDEVDLNLSEEKGDSDDDDDDDDDAPVRVKSRGGGAKAKAGRETGGVAENNHADMFLECPEEDAQIVEKILGARLGKRRIPIMSFSNSQRNSFSNGNVEVNDDVDVVGHDGTVMTTVAKETATKELQVEEYYVKYKNYSYLHCEWKTADELMVGDKRISTKIKRFQMKMTHPLTKEVDELDLFNQDYIEIDRVLDVAETIEPSSLETVTHYLVTWRSLPYEDATWELEEDVDREKIDAFLRIKDPPPPEQRQYKSRPNDSTSWQSLTESPVYKNDNVLRDYQLEGLNWLLFCYYNRQNCILADEMGLGKTIQSISFLRAVFDYGVHGPFLIIVPLSTVGNWQREFEAWTDLNAIVYHGTVASRGMIRQYEMYFKDDKDRRVEDVYKFHALITTYEVIITDFEELSSIDWRVAIIDEAHRLKNRNCKLLQGLSCFDLEHRVLLTGTPLQNNVDELFSLLSFLEPKQFSSLDTFMAEFGKLESESQVDKLKALLKPMMLRRLKEDVEKTIAPKEETIVEVELTNIQKKYYRAILERNFSFLAKGGSSSSNVPNLMNTMMELRKCCNHPYLINGAEEQIWAELRVAKYDAEKVCQAMVQASGKLVLIDKLLPKLMAGGHKILIFSQMIRVLDILEDYLIHRQILYERIDGRKRGNVRQEAIDRFSRPESDRFVFLLCTRAGGLGINLTAADTVIIYDSDWNPQNDLQAQARCHRIGQQKSVKVYRLITRNTYEREMFDRASMKLGLDKAVLQSTGRTGNGDTTGAMSKKEVEDLLKKGAYGVLMDEDKAGEEFCEEDIDHILQRRTQIIQIESGVKGSTFAKASFNLTSNRSDINIDDPNFWQKWAKKAEFDADETLRSELIMDAPRQRKSTARYGARDHMMEMSELDTDNSDPEVCPTGVGKLKSGRSGRGAGSDSLAASPAPGAEEGGGGKKKKKKKKSKRSRSGRDDASRPRVYSRSDCFKVEKNLLVYGWGRWSDILAHGRFKHRLDEIDILTIARAMLLFSLKHYEGDERIKQFIYDLISPTEDGVEKDCKNHTGLSAPVPRGRKGKKVKKDSSKKFVFDEDLSKLDIDVDRILHDDNYKKHLKRQSNKVLLRVRLLYYLKQEVIGIQAEKIFAGIAASEIDVPVLCADVYVPVYWWDTLADKCLLVGVFKHGYEKYNQMRQDPALCFLSRCGPPDNKALQAEQDDDDDIKEELDEDDDELLSQKSVEKKKDKNKSAKKQSNDDSTDLAAADRSTTDSTAVIISEDGKLPFPNASDLNTRFRRIITSFQRSHKQGMLKLEQVAKKMHKREQMTTAAAEGHSADTDRRYIGTAELQSMNLEGVGGNPLLLAEQLHWTRREESEFYRVVSTYGVERDMRTNQYIWGTFRSLGRLERKLDDTLTEYFKAFYFMCLKVCHRLEEDARPPNGLFVMPVTEERASRCLARIDLLNKIREHIIHHPNLDERLALCQPSSYLPDWWQPCIHDKDLLIGAARHGVAKTEEHIQFDPDLSFHVVAQHYAEMRLKEESAECSGNTVSGGVNATGSDGNTVNSGADSSVAVGGTMMMKREGAGWSVTGASAPDYTEGQVKVKVKVEADVATDGVVTVDDMGMTTAASADDVCVSAVSTATNVGVPIVSTATTNVGVSEVTAATDGGGGVSSMTAVDGGVSSMTAIDGDVSSMTAADGGVSSMTAADGGVTVDAGAADVKTCVDNKVDVKDNVKREGAEGVAADMNDFKSMEGEKIKTLDETIGGESEIETPAQVSQRWSTQWPKDRVIFHRLENICQCIDTGRWRLSRRHLLALQAAAQLAAASSAAVAAAGSVPEGVVPRGPDVSMLSVAVGGGHDYSMTRFAEDARMEDWSMKMGGSVKRRHRRTKAEMELARGSGSTVSVATHRDDDSTSLDLSSSATPSSSHTSTAEAATAAALANLSPDAPVNVVHKVSGYRPSGDERPTYRELTTWLREHTDFVVERSFYDEALMTDLQQRHHHHRHRRPRLDPHKLDLAQLTGDEKVAVINRHTCKKISGSKAPLLKELSVWLQRNPGFDIEYKWEEIVKSHLPESMYNRIQAAPPHSAAISDPSASLDTGLSLEQQQFLSIPDSQSSSQISELYQPITGYNTGSDSQSVSSCFTSPVAVSKNMSRTSCSSNTGAPTGLAALMAATAVLTSSCSEAMENSENCIRQQQQEEEEEESEAAADYKCEVGSEEQVLGDMSMECSEEVIESANQAENIDVEECTGEESRQGGDVTFALSSFSDDDAAETSSVDDTEQERYDDDDDDEDDDEDDDHHEDYQDDDIDQEVYPSQ